MPPPNHFTTGEKKIEDAQQSIKNLQKVLDSILSHMACVDAVSADSVKEVDALAEAQATLGENVITHMDVAKSALARYKQFLEESQSKD